MRLLKEVLALIGIIPAFFSFIYIKMVICQTPFLCPAKSEG